MPKCDRGFASLDRKRVQEIGRAGGKAAHAAGTAHEWDKQSAAAAGRKGGKATHITRGPAKAAGPTP